MNKIVGVFDAKAQFSKIIERAEHGEETVITRHGKVVAKVVPAARPYDRADAELAFEEMRAFKADLRARGMQITREEIKGLIDEGRRY